MIITNEDLLRIKCEDVLSNEISSLINSLEIELDNSNRLGNFGIGLAAPQIGIYKKAAIVRLDKAGDYNINLINPILEKGYDLSLFKDEGCLSIPGVLENTMRYQEIQISNSIYPYKFVATGLFAVAIQHEIDHLNSILFTDRKINKPIKKKIGPNELCFCGSGKKFKKCCYK